MNTDDPVSAEHRRGFARTDAVLALGFSAIVLTVAPVLIGAGRISAFRSV